MDNALILQQPSADAGAELLLLFHGVGSSAEDLQPLGKALAVLRRQAWIVSVRSPEPSDLGRGWQWFSVKAITESNRPERVKAALPRFLQTVSRWQDRARVDARSTTLIGFSQGAIMALEATQTEPAVASRVVAIAGRFAQLPTTVPPRTSVHLLHGDDDGVMPVAHAVEAAQTLQSMGAKVTLDRFARLGHGIDARVLTCIQQRLLESIPEERP